MRTASPAQILLTLAAALVTFTVVFTLLGGWKGRDDED